MADNTPNANVIGEAVIKVRAEGSEQVQREMASAERAVAGSAAAADRAVSGNNKLAAAVRDQLGPVEQLRRGWLAVLGIWGFVGSTIGSLISGFIRLNSTTEQTARRVASVKDEMERAAVASRAWQEQLASVSNAGLNPLQTRLNALAQSMKDVLATNPFSQSAEFEKWYAWRLDKEAEYEGARLRLIERASDEAFKRQSKAAEAAAERDTRARREVLEREAEQALSDQERILAQRARMEAEAAAKTLGGPSSVQFLREKLLVDAIFAYRQRKIDEEAEKAERTRMEQIEREGKAIAKAYEDAYAKLESAMDDFTRRSIETTGGPIAEMVDLLKTIAKRTGRGEGF